MLVDLWAIENAIAAHEKRKSPLSSDFSVAFSQPLFGSIDRGGFRAASAFGEMMCGKTAAGMHLRWRWIATPNPYRLCR
jgi:hypothetical protein